MVLFEVRRDVILISEGTTIFSTMKVHTLQVEENLLARYCYCKRHKSGGITFQSHSSVEDHTEHQGRCLIVCSHSLPFSLQFSITVKRNTAKELKKYFLI